MRCFEDRDTFTGARTGFETLAPTSIIRFCVTSPSQVIEDILLTEMLLFLGFGNIIPSVPFQFQANNTLFIQKSPTSDANNAEYLITFRC